MKRVTMLLSFPDAHVLRAYLGQNNHAESWQRRMIRDLDAAVDEATRERFPRPASTARRTRPHENAA